MCVRLFEIFKIFLLKEISFAGYLKQSVVYLNTYTQTLDFQINKKYMQLHIIAVKSQNFNEIVYID